MSLSNLPPPACKYGYTQDQLQEMFRFAFTVFERWMRGQTKMVCEGIRYNYNTEQYEEDCVTGHGVITYTHDVNRWLWDGRIVD